MPRFKVLAASHIEDGVKYFEGDVVESDKELDRGFANKFQRLDGGTKAPTDRDNRMNTAAGKMGDAPEHKRVKLKKKKRIPQADPVDTDFSDEDEEELDEVLDEEEDLEEEDEEEEVPPPKKVSSKKPKKKQK